MEFLKPKKDLYTPSDKKRYEVSPDEFSRKRIQALRDIHHKLEAELGIPISFSVFGSLVKGKILTTETARRADIDMWIDLDQEDLPINKKKEIAKLVREGFLYEIHQRKEDLGFNKIDARHIQTRILNEDVLPTIFNQVLKPSMLSYLNKFDKIYLSTFFTLSIGEPVKKYRKIFLAELALMPDQNKAEIIWKLIKNVVEEMERKGEAVPESLNKQFPQTLDEALKFYGILKE